MTDRRFTAANDRVAAQALQGQVDSPCYVVGQTHQVTVPVADLCATPNGPRDRQFLMGDTVQLFEAREGWGFVQADKDGYVGYLATGHYGAPQVPTHWVNVAATQLCPQPDFKTCETTELSLGAHVTIEGKQGAFSQTRFGWVPSVHLSTCSARPTDPVAVAEHLVGTPYLWGGNSRNGIDCSGLVQLACHICGFECPADSDLQAATLGSEIQLSTATRRGDLVFWKGHVAWVVDANWLLHANAAYMSTVYELRTAAIDRIAAQGDGSVTLCRRLSK
ncbi:MAG: NlpC/P60 family protein [Paracoccaceae bacterium]|nr:NlpC/P60 family protein [Paracoccaceae bacterium]